MNIRDGAGVIERLLRRGKYRHVLEIGTYRGFTAAFMSQFCERVTTIDLKYGRMERYNEAFDRENLTGVRFRAAVPAANIPAGLTQAQVTLEIIT